jgi:saccharopine dehydrogenase-like NADP-dependent oxidoreductase
LFVKTKKDLFYNQLYVRKNLGDQKMSNIIMVAGATGNLGAKIIDALLEHGADVRATVRLECSAEKIKMLRDKGVKVFQVDMRDATKISDACAGADCVVSALSGLRDVVIDLQKTLLNGAVKAGVPRFIPSDYSLDFTKLAAGTNRNLDWRREFHKYLDATPIKATDRL